MSITDRLDQIEARLDDDGASTWEVSDYRVLAYDAPAMLAALRAVLDRHKPYPDEGMGWREDHTYGYVGTVCGSCGTPDEYGVSWPCPTYRAITTALGEDQ